MIVSPGRGYIFVHIPKTGGTSLSAALETRAMADDILVGDTPKALRRRRRLDGIRVRGRLWKHATLADIDGLPGIDLSRMFVFTLVRNPWDRMVSYYAWARAQTFDHPAVRIARVFDFNAFLADPRVAAGVRNTPARVYLTDAGGTERVGTVVRLEALERDLEPVWERLGFRLEVPHLNRSDRGRDYREYYDTAARRTVADLCAEDIARFGYSF